jgi:hypothetical protein
VVTFLLQRFALVGRISWHALHRKFFSALGIGSFHKGPHISFCSTLEELSTCICNSLFLATWYALLTVNKPLVVSLHTSESPHFVLMGIDRIAFTLVGKNRFSIKALFHPCKFLSMSSTTIASQYSTLGVGCIAKVVERGTHLSPYIFVVSPFPILENKPSQRRSHEPKILLQA